MTVAWTQGGQLGGQAREFTIPLSGGGTGEGFSATELLLLSLGCCMAGTLLTFARGQGIPVESLRFTLRDEVADAPRRVARIQVAAEVRGDFTERQWASLTRAASHCKIHNTLVGGLEVELSAVRGAPV